MNACKTVFFGTTDFSAAVLDTLVTEGYEIAAVVTQPRLALVRKAGEQYARKREIAPELIEQIGTPMIPEEQYAAIVNGGV